MKVEIKNIKDIIYIKLIGKLDSNSSSYVTDEILKLIKKDVNITIDMGECDYVSSAGLRTLLTIGKHIKMKSGRMQIINLLDDVKEVIEMTGFDSILNEFGGR